MIERTFLRAAIHGASVTELVPEGPASITIDGDLLDAVDLDQLEQVEVWGEAGGSRAHVHVVRGERGSGEVRLCGPATGGFTVGERVTIAAYARVDRSELADFVARIAHVDDDNRLIETRQTGLADGG